MSRWTIRFAVLSATWSRHKHAISEKAIAKPLRGFENDAGSDTIAVRPSVVTEMLTGDAQFAEPDNIQVSVAFRNGKAVSLNGYQRAPAGNVVLTVDSVAGCSVRSSSRIFLFPVSAA
eukprot:1727177-Rhodomonas_salina.3